MPKSHPPYPAELKKRLVELVRAGRNPEELAVALKPLVVPERLAPPTLLACRRAIVRLVYAARRRLSVTRSAERYVDSVIGVLSARAPWSQGLGSRGREDICHTISVVRRCLVDDARHPVVDERNLLHYPA